MSDKIPVSILPMLAAVLAAIGLCAGWCARAEADFQWGPWTLNGEYQYELYSNDGHVNPNNAGHPGSPGLVNQQGNPMFQLMEQYADLHLYGHFSDRWSVYFEPRFWHDLTKSVDDHYVQYESVPCDFNGDGWMLRGGGNDAKAELWQTYVDYRNANLWIRAGKQTVAWGDDLAFRILDQVDSLDLSQLFFFGRGFEEFQRSRIPEWMARVVLNLPNPWIPDLSLETLASPGTWTPTILPQQGAPFNVIPAVLDYREHVEQGRAIFGGRLFGTLGGAEVTLNFLSRPASSATGLAGGLIPDIHGGEPLLAAAGNDTLYRIEYAGQHPRFFLYGGSLNYPIDWAGAILRLEQAIIPDQSFAYPNAKKLIYRPVSMSFVSFERPTYAIPTLSAMMVNFQFLETYTWGDTQHVYSSGSQIDHAVQSISIFVGQPLLNKTVDIEVLAAFDTSDGNWVQPGVHWDINDHYKFDLFYNSFGGAEKRRFPGAFWFDDGCYARVTVGF